MRLHELLHISVVDLGFREGGFHYSIVCEMHRKIFATTPIFDHLERDFLLYLSIDPLSIKIYAKACLGEP